MIGPIPIELGWLAILRDLWLDDNDLTGMIPPEPGSLAHLQHLDLPRNDLSGSIPAELGDLSLLLNNNRLIGEIPPPLDSLSNLEVLNLVNNRLSRCTPASLLCRLGLALRSGLRCIYYDSDDDGLIEVSTLARFDAIRFDLDDDGSAADMGYANAFNYAASDMGCPPSGCIGYELVANPDFDTDDSGGVGTGDTYWNEETGWTAIGRGDGDGFSAEFEGNGRAIDSLYVKTTDANAGLFSVVAEGGTVRNVRLESVNVSGRAQVGGLAGQSSVSGRANNTGGSIVASYASTPVSSSGNYVGGLVGSNWDDITASCAVGSVLAGGNPDGLVGRHGVGEVTASYWDRQTSGQARSLAGQGKTTSELQRPTAYTGICADWNVDIDGDGNADDLWSFGTSSEYPTLR